MDFKFENLAKIDEILLKMDILEQKISGAKKMAKCIRNCTLPWIL